MKTVRTKKINGHNVVFGFDNAVIDPEATKARVFEIMKEEDEVAKVEESANKIRGRNNDLVEDVKRNSDTRKKKRGIVLSTIIIKADIEKLIKEHVGIIKNYIKRRKEVAAENTIYFEPKAGEYILIDSDYKDLKKKVKNTPSDHKPCADIRGAGGLISSLKFSYVQDFRGRSYHFKVDGKWKRDIISELGDNLPFGGTWTSHLTRDQSREMREQSEIDRIKNMSLVDREKERDSKIRYYLRISAVEKTEYDLQGIENSLEKAKSNFETRKNEMLKKYE